MKSSNNSPTMVPPKKRRKASSPTGSAVSSPVSQARTPSTEENDQGKRKTTRSKDEETPIAAPAMALPPPLMPYPHPPHAHFVVQSPYYPLYPPTPFYVPVGSSPPLPPHRGSVGGSNSGSSNSNNNSANGANSKQSSGTPRILPKAPTGTECFPSPEYHPLYPHPHPYALPISPPTLRGKQPEALSTADQREQARKLSHSAIERRRRERINDKIVQLRQLIPSCADQEHLHKMTVLQSAIDYITYLKQVVSKLEGEDRVHVSLKMQKTPKSMLPKEVEPFTTQFSVQQGKPRRRSESSNSSSNSADQNDSAAASAAETKAMKPIDVIKAGEAIAADPPSANEASEESSGATWLPPPLKETAGSPCSSSASWQDENKTETNSNYESALPTPLLTPRPITNASSEIPTTSKSEENGSSSSSTNNNHQTKHMSLQNILC